MRTFINDFTEVLVNIIDNLIKDVTKFVYDLTKAMLILSKYIANIIVFILPFVMILIGNKVFDQRGHFEMGMEFMIPIIVFFVVYILKDLHRIYFETDKEMPKPKERFTTVDGSKVEINNDRLEELILYMQELEDWIENKE